MNKLHAIPEKVRNRKTEMCIRRPYMENDTVQYQLPKEFEVTDPPNQIGNQWQIREIHNQCQAEGWNYYLYTAF